MATLPGSPPLAPELDVSEWLGDASPLESLRGRVVLVETFQMLCPGCIRYGLPQAQRVHRLLPQVAVIGLHIVFEHHDVTGRDALVVFLSEFGIQSPSASTATTTATGRRQPCGDTTWRARPRHC
jgi:hypothetical protein